MGLNRVRPDICYLAKRDVGVAVYGTASVRACVVCGQELYGAGGRGEKIAGARYGCDVRESTRVELRLGTDKRLKRMLKQITSAIEN